MLLCQNGGTCNQNQKCICPPEFKGVLCQHSRCEAGKDCNGASLPHPSTTTLLLCTLLTYLLATLTPHWATKEPPPPHPPRPRTCVYECVCEATGDPGWEGPSLSWTRHCSTLISEHAHKPLPNPTPLSNARTHTSQDCNDSGCVLRCAKDKRTKYERPHRKEMQSEGGGKSYQPLFPLFLSWNNVHQTKKQTLKSPLFHIKGNGCCKHKDLLFRFFFFFSPLSWLTQGSHLRPAFEARGRAQGEDGTCRQRSSREALVWSFCWGLHSILTRFLFCSSKDETWFYIYSISAAIVLFFFKDFQSLYLMCPLAVAEIIHII